MNWWQIIAGGLWAIAVVVLIYTVFTGGEITHQLLAALIVTGVNYLITKTDD